MLGEGTGNNRVQIIKFGDKVKKMNYKIVTVERLQKFSILLLSPIEMEQQLWTYNICFFCKTFGKQLVMYLTVSVYSLQQ